LQWPNHYPNATAQYFLNFPFPASAPPKALQDVYIGIDVWGRGSHGGGGFGAYRAIEHIDPAGLGLSAALFGPAWTWESEQDKPGFSWAHWWAYERRLWLGPTLPGELVLVPEMKHRTGEAPCTHGPFRPLAHAFASRPAAASFFTTFSPGVGRAWFVEGRKVMEQPAGWTDVDKQGSLGDLLWPRPQVAWEGDARAEPPPRATAEVIMDDAWLGGSAVRVSLAEDGVAPDDVDDAVFRCVWVPVQAVHLQPGVPYTVTLVYKPGAGAGVELDVGLSAKDASVRPLANEDLPHGWVRLRVELVLAGGAPRAVDVGLVVGLVMDDPAQPLAATLTLGMLAVHPARAVAYGAKLLWAAYTPSAPGARFPGVLAWDAAAAFAPPRPLALTSPEDLVPAWELADGPGWFPQFAYFNVYAARVPGAPAPETAVFVGTTGLDGRANRLLVEEGMMPPAEDGQGWRFYVQGVTLEGEVLPWERCASADLEL
jgi:mannosyl-glycoprotein endo-beta-N-acetylglucosaminidase